MFVAVRVKLCIHIKCVLSYTSIWTVVVCVYGIRPYDEVVTLKPTPNVKNHKWEFTLFEINFMENFVTNEQPTMFQRNIRSIPNFRFVEHILEFASFISLDIELSQHRRGKSEENNKIFCYWMSQFCYGIFRYELWIIPFWFFLLKLRNSGF